MPARLQSILVRLSRQSRGSATVEFVIALPLILMILVLIADFGRALWYYHIVSEGVRDGARYLSRAPRDELATYTERARYLAMTGVADTSASAAYPWWTDVETVTVTGPTVVAGPPTFRSDFERLVVQAVVPVSLPLVAIFGHDEAITISAADEVRYIGD